MIFSRMREAHRRLPDLMSVALLDTDAPATVEAAVAGGAFATGSVIAHG